MRRKRDRDVDPSTVYPVTLSNDREYEYWTILAPKKEQQIQLPSLQSDGPWDRTPSFFCAYHFSFDAFKLLCNSIENIRINSDREPSPQSIQILPQQAVARSRPEELPTELVSLVFAFLEPEDFISLGLCSRTLWAHAIIWVQNSHLRWRNAYSWAGSPMACVGSKLEYLPQSIYDMFPEAMPQTNIEDDDSREDHQLLTPNRPSAWYKEMINRCEKTPDPHDDLYQEAFWKHIRSAGIPEELHGSMMASFPSFSVGSGSKWYLRNLTQKEYIRMEGIVTTDGEVTVSLAGSHWLTLDILLVWLISWRGDDDQQETYTWEQLKGFNGLTDAGLGDVWMDPTYGPLDDHFWPIWAGPWVGHSFDVVTERQAGEDWVDRTGEMDSLSDKIMRILYGLSMAEAGEAREYWAKIFEQAGGVLDLGEGFSSDSN